MRGSFVEVRSGMKSPVRSALQGEARKPGLRILWRRRALWIPLRREGGPCLPAIVRLVVSASVLLHEIEVKPVA
jgi:hypothetical protein